MKKLILLLLLISSVFAVEVIVDEYLTGGSDSFTTGSSGTDTFREAFSFINTTDAIDLTTISVQMKKAAGTPGDVYCMIQGDAAGDPDDSDIAGCVEKVAAFVDAGFVVKNFSFDTCNLSANTVYWAVFNTTDSAGASNQYLFSVDNGNGDGTSAGKYNSTPSISWTLNKDFYFQVLGVEAAPPAGDQEVIITTPPTNTISTDDTPTITYVPNATGPIISCDLFTNTTHVGTNSSIVLNASANTITASSIGSQAQYEMLVSCSNSTGNWNSTAISYFLDTEAPTIFWQVQPQNFTFGESTNYEVDFQDLISLSNATVDIYYTNGTQHSTDYQQLNLNGNVSWNVSDTISALDFGEYYLNASSRDVAGNFSYAVSDSFTVTNTSTSLDCYIDDNLITKGQERKINCIYSSGAGTGVVTPDLTDNETFYSEWTFYNRTTDNWFINPSGWIFAPAPGVLSPGNPTTDNDGSSVTLPVIVNSTTNYTWEFNVSNSGSVYHTALVSANNVSAAQFTFNPSGEIKCHQGWLPIGAGVFHTNNTANNPSVLTVRMKREVFGNGFSNFSCWWKAYDWPDFYFGGDSYGDVDSLSNITHMGLDARNAASNFSVSDISITGADISLVSNATCQFGDKEFSVQNGTDYFLVYDEDSEDGITVSDELGCSATGNEPQTSTFSYTNAFWVNGLSYNSFIDYSDVDKFTVNEGAGTGATKCTRFELPNQGTISAGDDIKMIGFFKEPGTDEPSALRIHTFDSNDLPDTGDTRASCVTQRNTITDGTYFECKATATNAVFQGGTYAMCSTEPDYIAMNTEFSPGGVAYVQSTPSLDFFEFIAEPGLAFVYGGSSNFSTGDVLLPRIRGKVFDGATTDPLSGITLQLSIQNDTVQKVSGSDGSYSFNNLQAGTQIWFYVTAQSGYESWEYSGNPITLGETDDIIINPQLSPLVGLLTVSQVIDTNYGDFELNNEYLHNITVPKDATLNRVTATIQDTGGDPPETAVSVSINTSCSFSVNPTNYFLVQRAGSSIYDLVATIGGENTTLLLASCSNGATFGVRYQTTGLDVSLVATFEGKDLITRNYRAYRGSQSATAYTSLYILYDVLDSTDNTKVTNASDGLMCNTTILNSTRNEISALTWPVLYSDNRVETNVTDFSLTASVPSSVLIRSECVAPGYDYLVSTSSPIPVSEDVFNVTDCRLEDEIGRRYDYMKPNEVRHIVCSLSTFDGVSLSATQVWAVQSEYNVDIRLSFKNSDNNIYTFSSAFTNILPKGWWTWKLEFINLPDSVEDGVEFQTFTRVYDNPPKKVSSDFCDGLNCPKDIHKGDPYFCKIETQFETEYTRENMWIEVDGNRYDIPFTKTRTGNNWLHSITINQVGMSGEYGVDDDTETIKCFSDFFIDGESIYYSLVTSYDEAQAFDVLGINAFLVNTLRGSDPLGAGASSSTGFIDGLIGGVLGLFSGDIDPFTAIFWFGVIAIAVALLVVIAKRREGK